MPGIRYLGVAAVILGALWVSQLRSSAAGARPYEASLRPAGTTASPRPEPPVDPALMKLGKSVYTDTCSKCHQSNGRGIPGAFPPLADNPNLKDVSLIVNTIKSGHSGRISIKGKEFEGTMPPMGVDLSNEQIAAVATYVRNSWGNRFGAVTQKEVAAIVSKGESP